MDVFEEGIRKDYEPMREKGSRVGFEAGQVGRRKVAPSELAAYNLFKTLEKYPEFTKEARSDAQAEFSGFNDLAVMNLETFASVLTFLKHFENPSPADFKDEVILPYFSRLLPTRDITEEERKRLIVRNKAVFLKYIRAILSYRASREEFVATPVKEGEEEEEEEIGEEKDEYEDDYVNP